MCNCSCCNKASDIDFRISRYKNQGHKPLMDALITSWIKSKYLALSPSQFHLYLVAKAKCHNKGVGFFSLLNHIRLPEEVSYIAQKQKFLPL